MLKNVTSTLLMDIPPVIKHGLLGTFCVVDYVFDFNAHEGFPS